ncbi:MAG TPA: FliI/YscN family ATPase [Phycisphaerales bacterium]|nr:FliI/YscN family ATPase [Phycisphaerales bacterium]
MSVLEHPIQALRTLQPRRLTGSVAVVRGLTVLVDELPLPIGAMVRIVPKRGVASTGRGEVIGFDGRRSVVMLLGTSDGIAPGCRVIGEQVTRTITVGHSLLGRVINGLGEPLDGRPLPLDGSMRLLDPPPTPAMRRRRIVDPLPTGVAAIDAMLTLGKGQRVGVFSGPGVGKSTLLASIARNTDADINVIALIGERGREVRDFIETVLGEVGLRRSIVVVATGDESPLMRVRAAMVACAIAEHFRACGTDVMLMMDSITRFAQAQRQIGLAAGEQPATKGYTPSVFAMLPRLLERAGALEAEDGGGSITGLYAVLVEGDELAEPVSDAARGILDGHIALSPRLAARGHYPAIDLLRSISRVADDVCDGNHVEARRRLIRLMAAYADAEELINIGAYAKGANADCDTAIAIKPMLDGFLQRSDRSPYPETCRDLIALSQAAVQHQGGRRPGPAPTARDARA